MISVKFSIITWMLVLLCLSVQSEALEPDEVTEILLKAQPDMPVLGVRESEIAGMYAVDLQGGYTLYVSEDGKYFISGALFAIDDNRFVNVKELHLKPLRRERIAALDDAEFLTYAPPADKIKQTIYVFTDIDCGYCRKMHQEIPLLNEFGIAVKYLAYPRTGLNTESFNKAVSAWCSSNPNQALTRAKAGHAIPVKTCANPVAKHYVLGQELGINGTPSIIYEDGTLQPGYAPAKELATRLGVL